MSKNDELRSKSAEELNKELLELRRAQFGLQAGSGARQGDDGRAQSMSHRHRYHW